MQSWCPVTACSYFPGACNNYAIKSFSQEVIVFKYWKFHWIACKLLSLGSRGLGSREGNRNYGRKGVIPQIKMLDWFVIRFIINTLSVSRHLVNVEARDQGWHFFESLGTPSYLLHKSEEQKFSWPELDKVIVVDLVWMVCEYKILDTCKICSSI